MRGKLDFVGVNARLPFGKGAEAISVVVGRGGGGEQAPEEDNLPEIGNADLIKVVGEGAYPDQGHAGFGEAGDWVNSAVGRAQNEEAALVSEIIYDDTGLVRQGASEPKPAAVGRAAESGTKEHVEDAWLRS